MKKTGRMDLVRACSKKNIATYEEARNTLSVFLNVLTEHMAAGRFIEIRCFGNFFAKEWRARRTVNRNGVFQTPPRRMPRFRPSPELARAMTEAHHARQA